MGTDPATSVVDEQGRLRCLVSNFSLHVDVIGGGSATFISADWPGELSRAILRRLSESDILQETLVTASARLESFEFRGEGSFQRWLTGIANNTRREVLRRGGLRLVILERREAKHQTFSSGLFAFSPMLLRT